MIVWRHLRPIFALLYLWALLLVVAGCTGAEGSAPRYAFTPVADEPEGRGVAPDFQISVYQGDDALGGRDVKFSKLLGKQPIVLNFWAGLCPPCRAEMPDLQAMYNQNQDPLLLFGLDVGPFVGLGSREDGRRLLQELKVTFPTGTTFDAQVVRNYKLVGMPTTYFIKPDGTIHRQWTGLLNKKKLDELVNELLTASKG
ncbi:MAG: TlpA family protein disulfide reductase [Chloroflexi bacterium]|nr:TlpA family protein disulfide reductase [Chloroflexota bacterium]